MIRNKMESHCLRILLEGTLVNRSNGGTVNDVDKSDIDTFILKFRLFHHTSVRVGSSA